MNANEVRQDRDRPSNDRVVVLETPRLILRHFTPGDAEFVIELLNQESFIRFVGDRGVRTVEDARKYIRDRFTASYEKNGYGLYCVELKDSGALAGLCGLVCRDTLPHPDIGFAFLPQYWSQGYARECASAVLDLARNTLDLWPILAITDPNNVSSIRLLEKLGFRFERRSRLSDDAIELNVYSTA